MLLAIVFCKLCAARATAREKQKHEERKAYFENFRKFAKEVLPHPRPLPPQAQQLEDLVSADERLCDQDKAALKSYIRSRFS